MAEFGSKLVANVISSYQNIRAEAGRQTSTAGCAVTLEATKHLPSMMSHLGRVWIACQGCCTVFRFLRLLITLPASAFFLGEVPMTSNEAT